MHFPCHVRLNRTDVFVLWYQDDRDGFVRSASGRMLRAASRDALAAHAATMGITVELEAGTEYDFDRLREWCRRPTAVDVDCPTFLDAWNFFDDSAGLYAATMTEYAQLSRAAAGCYDKLFWGNNLPCVTPVGERFDPAWSPAELAAISRVFEAGLVVVEAELAGSPDAG